MDDLNLDWETFSRLDLLKVGASRYSRDPSCRVLLGAWSLNRGPVQQWAPATGEPFPVELRQALADPQVRKRAWNAPFEMAITANVLHLPVDYRQWRCTMVKALASSLPGSLKEAGDVVGIGDGSKKSLRGQALIRLFCQPQKKPTKKRPMEVVTPADAPEEWQEFCDYNRQDVIAEMAVDDKLRDLPEHEWEFWFLDREINARGLPINMAMVRGAIDKAQKMQARNIARLTKITGLANPNSSTQLLGWLQDRGYPFSDMRKGHVLRAADAVKENPAIASEDYRDALALRREVSRTSVKKFDALERATNEHNSRLENTIQFAAAGRTWRFGGRMFQPQNLANPAPWIQARFERDKSFLQQISYDVENNSLDELIADYGSERVMDILSACVRPAVKATPGHVLIVVDLNAIENRMLGWMADDQEILGVFKRKEDPYIAFGSHMYGVPYAELYAEYKGGNGKKRKIAKPGCLGCGYMLSAGTSSENKDTGEIEWTGLMAYAQNMHVTLTLEQAELSVSTWRGTYKDAKAYWYKIAEAAMNTVGTGREHDAGPVWFSMAGSDMLMHLPSGRSLTYIRPWLDVRRMWWGKDKEVLLYDGLNDKNKWGEIQTHPGKLTENADQAMSRDILKHGIELAEREGIDVILHVHDEIVAEVREREADRYLKILEECMSDVPSWAKGLPLGAKGSVSPIYVKD